MERVTEVPSGTKLRDLQQSKTSIDMAKYEKNAGLGWFILCFILYTDEFRRVYTYISILEKISALEISVHLTSGCMPTGSMGRLFCDCPLFLSHPAGKQTS